ncbi:MAG: sulfotransferase [Candidatus Binatia bacterium]
MGLRKTSVVADQRTQLVYILAASHSGSTLLASLLANHHGICTVGELKMTALGQTSRYRCSCQSLVDECSFWSAITQQMAQAGFAFSVSRAETDLATGATPYVARLLRPLHRGPALEWVRDMALNLSSHWRAQLPRIQERNAALVASISAQTGKSVVIDSSKVGLRLKYLLRNPRLDVKVIRLIRDGRAVALTYMDPAHFADAREPSLRGGGMGGERADERMSIRAAAWEWRRSNEEAEAIVRQLPADRWTSVRYESLCTDTTETLRRLFAFIGVEPDTGEQALRSYQHHMIGNGMRLDNTTLINLDDRWRMELTPHDLQSFDSVAGDLNRCLGYQQTQETLPPEPSQRSQYVRVQ